MTQSSNEFIKLVETRQTRVAVIGLGYVGLPLALGFADAGFKVLGLDVDPHKIEILEQGGSYISYIPGTRVKNVRERDLLEVTVDFDRVREADAIIICVPTPIGHHLEPDLSYVTSTLASIKPHLRPGQLISLESTTYPGTTSEVVCSKLENDGLRAGEDLYFVFSPEREDPGNHQFPSHKIPKLVGGITPECCAAGVALYGAVFETVVPVSQPAVAEFAKLLENIFRSVNIGLVNELKMVADRMGIDIWEVINAAATKPFGFTPFYPGPGVGGHCIPVDPFYLTWKAKEFGIHTRFVELAAEINNSMPEYVVERAAEKLNSQKKALNGSRILVLGLSFKANVEDVRGAPSFRIMELLKERLVTVEYHDPHVPVIPPTREHQDWTGQHSVPWDESLFRAYDCVIIATPHAAYNLDELATWCDCIIDTRNLMARIRTRPGQVTKA